MRKGNYFGPRGLTRNERRLGRFLRDGEGHQEAGSGDNNPQGTGVTTGESTPQPGSGDNTGQQFDATSFWGDQSNPNGGEPNPNDGAPDVGKEVLGMIQNFKVNPIFDAEVAKQVSEGNLEGVNKNFADAISATARQSVVLTAHILKAFEASMESRIQAALNSNNNRQSTESLLGETFQAYKEPAMKPVIRSIYDQALANSKGDGKAALEMTKSMLKIMGQTGQSDFGIKSAAPNPEDFLGSGPADLVKSLLESPH